MINKQLKKKIGVVLVNVFLLLITVRVTAQSGYEYDQQGRLVTDPSEEISLIEWNNRNQIVKITRSDKSIKSDLVYKYDARGNKVMRIVMPRDGSGLLPEDTWKYFYYINHDKLNTLAIYQSSTSKSSESKYIQTIKKQNQRLWASLPIGLDQALTTPLIERTFTARLSAGRFTNVEEVGILIPQWQADLGTNDVGRKQYELSNHGQNRITIVSDRIVETSENDKSAEVLYANDYYPFGMVMADRRIDNSEFPFGFAGKEKEDRSDVDRYDYGARRYDARLSRWLSIDAMADQYSPISPYTYALNNPISAIDPDGNKVTTTIVFDEYYGAQYNILTKTKGFQAILKDFEGSRNFHFRIHENEVYEASRNQKQSFLAVEKPEYRINRQGKRIALNDVYGNFSARRLVNDFYITERDGKKYGVITVYSDIYLAFTIVHEAIHGMEDVQNFPKDKALDHSTFNVHHDLLVKTLKEYAQQKSISVTDSQLEDLSWYGTEESVQFNEFIDNRIKEQGKTPDEANRALERSAWRERTNKLIFEVKEREL